MPTYVYETLPESPAVPPKRFEVKQSMRDEPLARHPETGERVRRVISGGLGIITGGKPSAPAPSGGSCGSGCGCHS